MKDNRKIRKVLIGSASVASITILIVGVFAPSLYMNAVDSDENIENSKLTGDWDIIVPDDYTGLQDAVDNARSGDRIFVRSGIYASKGRRFSSSIEIETEGLTIHGENESTTIIDGRGRSNPVVIKADYVNFSGFKIINNGLNGSLMRVYSNYNIIRGNIFEVKDYFDGIEYGIKLSFSDNNTISDNHVSEGDKGVYMACSDDNIIDGNIVENNDYGIDLNSGFSIDLSKRIGEKISREGCSYNVIKNNVISNNYYGIVIDSSQDNLFLNNTFSSNSRYGLIMASCSNNRLDGNVFINDGVEIWGSDLSHFIHDFQGNMVNGKPLYYFKHERSFSVPSDAGQIILVDCYQVSIENVVISNTSTAVIIAFSEKVIIKNSMFSGNYRGVYLLYSTDNSIYKNNFIGNRFDAQFIVSGFIKSKSNKWNENYWDAWIGLKFRLLRFLPKRIPGRLYLQRPMKIFDRPSPGIRTRNFDWHPAKEPYEIN